MKEAHNLPIIHPFVHNGKYYVYDTNRNEILLVTQNIFEEIKKLQTAAMGCLQNEDETDINKKAVLGLIERGYLRGSRIQTLRHPLSKYVAVLPERKTNNLILQITKRCNFKCRYCSFTEIDAFERNHESISMDWNTAKKAIDFLFEKSRDSLDIRIGFYGGEPFLEFPLLQKCIEYAESIFETKELFFYATTNASILNNEIVSYLESHNFNLRISLDGPKDIQDKHRRYSQTGKGTYGCVLENLLNIKSKHPVFFRTLTFNPVIFADEDIIRIRNFFVDFLGVSEENITPTFADTRGFDYIYNSSFEDKSSNEVRGFEKKLNRENISEHVLKVLKRREEIPEVFSHSGPCLAGSTKVFCSTEGKLYPCEKITECEWANIGDLSTGYNYDKICALTNICDLSKDECTHCWAIRFCKICAAQCCNGSCENVKMSKHYLCETIKKNADIGLRKYIDLMTLSNKC